MTSTRITKTTILRTIITEITITESTSTREPEKGSSKSVIIGVVVIMCSVLLICIGWIIYQSKPQKKHCRYSNLDDLSDDGMIRGRPQPSALPYMSLITVL